MGYLLGAHPILTSSTVPVSPPFLQTLRAALARTSAPLAFLACVAAAWTAPAADIYVRLRPTWPEPANLVINAGDRVIWEVRAEEGRAARVEDLAGAFDSGVMLPPNHRFSHVFEEPGFHAYRHITLSILPPYEPVWWPIVQSAGTIEVRAPKLPPHATLNSPPEGARFPRPTAPDGSFLPAHIPLSASVEETNHLARVEFLADGERFGMAFHWPYTSTLTTDRVGRILLSVKAVRSDGSYFVSAPVPIHVEAISEPSLRPPRLADRRNGIYLIEYQTMASDRWSLHVWPDIVNPATAYRIHLGGAWGWYPVQVSEPRAFFILQRGF